MCTLCYVKYNYYGQKLISAINWSQIVTIDSKSFAIVGVHVVNGAHGMQTAVNYVSYKAVLENAQTTGPDYDEIKDEPYAEKSSEKLHQLKDKSMELTKSSNNYFTLMPQEAQTESITNVNLVRCYF